jgi:hypothetical protein
VEPRQQPAPQESSGTHQRQAGEWSALQVFLKLENQVHDNTVGRGFCQQQEVPNHEEHVSSSQKPQPEGEDSSSVSQSKAAKHYLGLL